MARNTTKTPSEIVAEMELKLAAAKAREARELASENPILALVYKDRDSYSKDIAALSRQMNGPQSFANRREGFQLRLAEIDAGERLAKAQDANYRLMRSNLDAIAEVLAVDIAKGKEITQDDYNAALAILPGITDTSELQNAYNIAHGLRKHFTEQRAKKDEAEISVEVGNENQASA